MRDERSAAEWTPGALKDRFPGPRYILAVAVWARRFRSGLSLGPGNGLPLRAALAAGGLSGLLLWVASPAVGAAPVAWVAIVPAAAVALAGRPLAARLAVPIAYGVYLELLLVPALPFGIADGQWGDPALPVLIAGSPVLFVGLVAVPIFTALLYLVRFGTAWGADRLPGPVGVAGAVAVPAVAWTALDFARVNLDPAGPWGPLYHSQWASVPGELASLGGPWLLTLAIVLANYALALAVVRSSPRPLAVPAAILLAAAIAALGGGGSQGERVVRVAAVQPGFDTANEDRPALRRFEPESYPEGALDVVAALAGPTREAAGRGAVLVVWPEAVMFVDLREHRPVRRAVSRLAREAGVALVVGWFDRSTTRSGATIVGSDGRLAPARPKQRPVWFIGERALDAPAKPIAVGGLRVGILLGLDVQDPGVAAALAARGAHVLASATHDWKQLATQQRASARVAARVTGLPVVRADWRFGSAVYAAHGTPVADAGKELREALLIAEVRTGEASPYARSGDLVAWLAVALAALAAATAALARRRRER